MRTSMRGDCFEVCENYGRCFDMACNAKSPAEGLQLEYVMDEADRQQRNCGEERCAILDTVRSLAERQQTVGSRVAEAALRHYQELLDESRSTPTGVEYTDRRIVRE